MQGGADSLDVASELTQIAADARVLQIRAGAEKPECLPTGACLFCGESLAGKLNAQKFCDVECAEGWGKVGFQLSQKPKTAWERGR